MSGAGPRHVTVIGAGAVGMSAALYLQKDGHRVSVIDPRGAGRATSFGNAGAIVVGSCIPTSVPGLWRKVPGWLMDPAGPFRVRPAYLPRIAPWLWRFLKAGRADRVEQISIAMHQFTSRAGEPHRELAALAGVSDLLRPVGWLKVYGGPDAAARTAFDRGILSRRGVRFEVLDGDALRQLEPGIAPRYEHAVFQPDALFAAGPGELIAAYGRAFVERGGEIIQESVRRIEIGPEGPARLVTDLAIRPVEVLVLAAGAWSRPLAAQLGADVPLDTERGYHLKLSLEHGEGLRRPTAFVDEGFVLAPMNEGIRLTSGVELAGVEAPPDFRSIRAMLPKARAILPGLGAEVSREWLGFRPSLPDSMPVMGRSKRFRDVYFAFGHQHVGLSLGPVTGRVIADLVAGRDPGVDLSPFREDRF
ncbi:MAG: FAD-binding oxidoreductase [Thalassobaculales bacterium]